MSADVSEQRVHVFGIRHHGPGSARSLEQALELLQPDCVLIEGPPDADGLLPLAAHEQMQPPVALLVYAADEPMRSAFYPFAAFSPEWRAIQYGLRTGAALRFMDLPQWHQLAPDEPQAQDAQAPAAGDTQADSDEGEAADGAEADAASAEPVVLRHDPLGSLAEAAGFSDGERWWDYLVESRRHEAGEIFTAVREAMAALRESLPGPHDLLEQRREAYMRKTLRAAMQESFERIAVVCGAWHAPALDPENLPTAKHDNDLLRGLKKVRTEAAWSPWTYGRLASGWGYGAGVVSPAYYDLLWSNEPHVAIQWMTQVGRLMRDSDLEVSSAHVIEAVRLSEALAAMRNRPLPGLEELDEAALTVVCGGYDAPMALIRRKLVIGERLGAVPDEAPAAPLQRDLAALQKRLRLPAKAEAKPYDLDLRKPIDLERSWLLHRMNLLGIPWGEPGVAGGRTKGTFHEHWQVQWEPEFAVKLIEGSRFGNTVEAAAAAVTIHTAAEAQNLAQLTAILDDALLAALPTAVERLVDAIQDRAATSSDVPQLMDALPPLARVMRYGNVRQTDAALVGGIVEGILARVCVGLPGACVSINDDAARELFERVRTVQAALSTLQDETLLQPWYEALGRVARNQSAHFLLASRAVRILHDAGRIEPHETERHMSLALSPATDRVQAAAWIEGFLLGSGLVLIHDTKLWQVIDAWVSSLDGEAFTEVLPLLRRTFSTFESPERRQMGERAKRGAGDATPIATADTGFNHARAAKVLPLIAKLLGTEAPS